MSRFRCLAEYCTFFPFLDLKSLFDPYTTMHKLKGDKKQKCQQFLMLIDYGLDEKTAINILKEVGWDINNAMDYYFRNGHKLQATGSTTAAASTRNAVKDIFKKYRTLTHD